MAKPLRASRPTHHMCPRRDCLNEVDNRLFCCPGDWSELSIAARALVVKTRTLPVIARERRAALIRAESEWDLLDRVEE